MYGSNKQLRVTTGNRPDRESQRKLRTADEAITPTVAIHANAGTLPSGWPTRWSAGRRAKRETSATLSTIVDHVATTPFAPAATAHAPPPDALLAPVPSAR